MIVALNRHEFQMAAAVGLARQISATLSGASPAFPEQYPGQLWFGHIGGACAELAVAKVLGAYWDGSVDVGSREDITGWGVDVRFSPTRPKVRPRDLLRIVAVTTVKDGNRIDFTKYRILGWLPADSAKRDEWASDSAPLCYFPPEDEWHHITTLEPLRS